MTADDEARRSLPGALVPVDQHEAPRVDDGPDSGHRGLGARGSGRSSRSGSSATSHATRARRSRSRWRSRSRRTSRTRTGDQARIVIGPLVQRNTDFVYVLVGGPAPSASRAVAPSRARAALRARSGAVLGFRGGKKEGQPRFAETFLLHDVIDRGSYGAPRERSGHRGRARICDSRRGGSAWCVSAVSLRMPTISPSPRLPARADQRCRLAACGARCRVTSCRGASRSRSSSWRR